MVKTQPNAGRVFLSHIAAAVLISAVVGGVYYALDVLWSHRQGFHSLGQTLPQILGVYLASVVGLGLLVALPVGLVSASLKRLTASRSIVGFYAGVIVFLIGSLWLVHDHYLSGVLGVVKSGDFYGVLVLAIVCVLFALLLTRLAGKRRWPGLPAWSGLAVLVLAAIVGIVSSSTRASVSLPGARGPAQDKPNIVMIVLDALRADHMSAYGYERETSPNMDRLAEDGTIFLKARSHGNRTILAMPALFTSLYPSFNGALHAEELMNPLPENHTTIAELLRAAGYSTVGIMSNIYLKRSFGMTQGFDRVVEFNGACYKLSLYNALRRLRVIRIPEFAVKGSPKAWEVTDHALAWLDVAEDRPLFLYLHYMDTHHPYEPPAQYASMFGGGGTSAIDLFNKSRRRIVNDPDVDFTDNDLATLIAYYDATIRYADHEIGRVLDEVRRIAAERETIVIITSDHGDEFLEHGNLYHNNLLIEELTHVPLIIWAPKRFPGGQRVDSLVRHIDVLPTLAEIVGVQPPEEAMGTSLVPLLDGTETDLGLSSFAEGNYCTSHVDGDWKIMYVDSTNTTYLYNLAEDPNETRDLSQAEPERFESMRVRLEDYRDKASASRRALQRIVDEETIRQLKKLGYL